MSTDIAKISVIIPVYKVEKYLKRCIESVINQTYTNIEIILVDDGSPDGSGKICETYGRIDNRIKVIHQENKGLPEARNSGLSIATGDYIGFVDSDDYIELDMYEYLLSLFQIQDVDIVCCGVKRVFGEGKRVELSSRHKEVFVMNREQAFEEFQLYDSIGSGVWNKLFKARAFEGLRFENYHRLEDSWFLCQCIAKAENIVYGPSYKYNYIIRSNSITHSTYTKKAKEILEVANDNYYTFKEQYPDNTMTEIGRILWYVVYINEMIVGKGNDKQTISYTKKLIRDNKEKIVHNNNINMTRKFQLLLLYHNYHLYKYFYIIYMKVTGK